jgi:predicted transposase YdaD
MREIPDTDNPKPIPQQHDKTYRLLFSYPQMVQDAMKLIPEPWVDELDFSTLEKMADSQVSERLDMRFQDVVWKVRCRDTHIYLCLLIEFQSTTDPYMIFRILFYQAAFYADQIRQLQDKDKPDPLVYFVEDEQGHRYAKFPLAISIVCYNGKPIWWPSLDLASMLHTPAGLEHLIPKFSYLLVDEHRIPEERLGDQNLLAALIGLEKTDSLEGLLEAFSDLLMWIRDPGIRRAFAVTVKVALIRLGLADASKDVTDPEEIKNMLAANLMEWRDRVREEGREEGQLEGEALIVTRQLQLKFGTLDEVNKKRIAEADSETLLRWADRVLTTEKLSDVFDGER